MPSDHNQTAVDAAVIKETGKVVQCARWLSLYPGTVGRLRIDCRLEGGNPNSSHIKSLAQHVLAQRLKAASVLTRTSSCNSQGSSALAAGLGASRPLRLQAFTCVNHLACPAIVSALPAATLTELQILLPRTATAQWHKALSSLSNLRSLRLQSDHPVTAYFSSINKLTQLTELMLDKLVHMNCFAVLPQQLRNLYVVYAGNDKLLLDVVHLKQLQVLTAAIECPEIVEAHLPPQLQQLSIIDELSPAIAAYNIASVQQLKELYIADTTDAPQDLTQLKHLQQLEILKLSYSSSSHAVAAAHVWPHLQQLMHLELAFVGTALQVAAAMDAVSLLSKLTSLNLSFEINEVDEDALVQADDDAFYELSGICKFLKDLRSLKHLHVRLDELEWNVDGHRDDVLCLSNLTGLTHLCLRLGRRIDSSMASAVLLELTQLNHVTTYLMSDVYALPVIGKLHQLTCLNMYGLSPRAQRSGLRFLTGLRKLCVLRGFDSCSDEDWNDFWDNLGA